MKGQKGFLEQEHFVTQLQKFLPAGPTESDPEKIREHDIVQFVAKHGGIRTVKAIDLTLL